MKKINFKNVYLQNFLSVGNQPIELDFSKSGIFAITGQNKDKGENETNGVGKSVLVDGLFFALFGETIRDIKKEEIVNNINGKKCLVRLEFDCIENGSTKTFIIERGIAPSYCRLYEDSISEDNDRSLSTIPATTDHIKKILNTTPTIFKYLITMSLNGTLPFMSLKKNEKREFIENIIKIEILKTMTKKSKELNSEITKDFEVFKMGLSQTESTLSSLLETKRITEESVSKKIEECTKKIESCEIDIQTTNSYKIVQDKSVLNSIEESISKLNGEFSVANGEFIKSNSNLSAINAKIDTNTNNLKREQDRKQSLILNYKKNQFSIPQLAPNLSLSEKRQFFLEHINTLDENLLSLSEKRGELNSNISKFKSEIADLNKFGNMCNECKRPFSNDDLEAKKNKIATINQSIEFALNVIDDIQKKVPQFNGEKEKCKIAIEIVDSTIAIDQLEKTISIEKQKATELTEINEQNKKKVEEISKLKDEELEKRENYKKIEADNQLLIRKIELLEQIIKENKNLIEKYKNDGSQYESLIQEQEENKKGFLVKMSNSKEKMDIYDVIKYILSDEGVRAFAIKRVLKTLNSQIDYYLNKMESNAKLYFDEYFSDNITNDRNVECSYENFSGGERKRIDLSTLFSFMDLRRIQGDVSFNLVAYDELLDSAISSRCAEKLFDILEERLIKYGESSYIITHRKENLTSPKINEVIQLIKLGGFTKRA